MIGLHSTSLLRSISLVLVGQFCIFSVLWGNPSVFFVKALAASSVSRTTTFPTVPLQEVETTQSAILDGAEWASIKSILQETSSAAPSSKYGYMTVVVGKGSDGQKIIGMQASSSDLVYESSVARVPSSVSTKDAIATYIAGLSTVHAVLPQVEGVGGSGETALVGGKVVVMGGNDLACFAAEGLATLGVHVCLVSTGSPKVRPPKQGKVEILKPAVGSEDLGFAAAIGKFDSLLDTLGNERPLDPRAPVFNEEDENDDDNSFTSLSWESSSSKSVLNLLKARHGCHRYVSTMTHCQSLVAKEGILGGPRQADEYAKRVGQQPPNNAAECQPVVPWSNLGSTVEAMLNAGVVFSSKSRDKLYQKSKVVRGWNLGDFWEQSTWPRDSAGNAQIRFGLPVMEDPDLEEERMIAEAPSRPGIKRVSTSSAYGDFDFSAVDGDELEGPPKPVQDNPFVYQVAGVQGVKAEIMEEGLDCILFLSAKFCKTCRSIDPQYTRMARIAKEEQGGITTYAKAETSGKWGKELGRYLGVDAVPAFILYRNGQRFGSPLSVSRLPSRKIDRALSLLQSGAAWDPDVLKEEEDGKSSP